MPDPVLIPAATDLPTLQFRVAALERELAACRETLLGCCPEQGNAQDQMLREITRALPVMVYVLDIIDRVPVYSNEHYVAVHGFTQEEIRDLGPDYEAVIHPDDLPRLMAEQALFANLADGDCMETEYRLRTAKHGWRFLSSRSTVFRRDPDGRVRLILGVSRDVTDLRAAQAAAQANERRYRLLADHSTDMISRHSPSGDFLYASPACLALTGYRADELVSRSWWSFIHVDERTFVASRFALVCQDGSCEPFSFRSLRKDGSFVWVESVARLVQGLEEETPEVVCVSRDISLRMEAEEALRESERRYRLLAENSTDMISRYTPAGVCTYVSPAVRDLFGYDPAERVGGRAESFIHPDDLPILYDTLPLVRETPNTYTVSYRGRCKDGEYIWVETTARGVHDPATGVIQEIICSTRNISERRRLEEQFLQAQKMEAIGRLAGGVAHDFNNLLTVINFCTAGLVGENQHPDRVRRLVEQIQKASGQATRLTGQLLAFSRKQVRSLVVLDLNAVVSRMTELLTRLVGEDIAWQTHLSRAPLTVLGDLSQLEQVLLNLVVNARDAMPEGGKLIIATEPMSCRSGDLPPNTRPGDYACLSVRDTGLGMDAATRARIFEPFFTTKEGGKGTGLGLATVYAVVQQCQGFVRVDSRPGEGACFEVCLPLVTTPTEPTERRPLAPEPSLGGRELVLLAEDDGDVRTLTAEILETYGYRVLQAANGDEALAAYHLHGGSIDLLLTDLGMPGINGRELAERLRALQPDLKILFASGRTDDVKFHTGVQDGRFAFLAKPFTPATLIAKIRGILDG